MQIKKFKARTLKEAIAEMKTDFGDEAIVLSTKVIDEYLNGVEQKLFEITASIDEEESLVVEENFREMSKAQDFQTEMKKLTEKIYGISSDAKVDKNKPNLIKNNQDQKRMYQYNHYKVLKNKHLHY